MVTYWPEANAQRVALHGRYLARVWHNSKRRRRLVIARVPHEHDLVSTVVEHVYGAFAAAAATSTRSTRRAQELVHANATRIHDGGGRSVVERQSALVQASDAAVCHKRGRRCDRSTHAEIDVACVDLNGAHLSLHEWRRRATRMMIVVQDVTVLLPTTMMMMMMLVCDEGLVRVDLGSVIDVRVVDEHLLCC